MTVVTYIYLHVLSKSMVIQNISTLSTIPLIPATRPHVDGLVSSVNLP